MCLLCVLHAGRYLSVDSAGELSGKSEAVGQRETWEPVFEEVALIYPQAHTISLSSTHAHLAHSNMQEPYSYTTHSLDLCMHPIFTFLQ